MYWSEVLDNAQGVMVLEGIENSRTALPMADSSGMASFRKAQQSQLESVWDIMFPRSSDYYREDEERRKKFIEKRNTFKKMKEEINRERGTNSV